MLINDLSLNRTTPGIVETPGQVYSILIVSIIMGAVFGFIFGTLDVEDAGDKLATKLWIEEQICLPIAFTLGATAGVL